MRASVKVLYALIHFSCVALTGCIVTHPHRGPHHVPPGHRRVPPGHLRHAGHVHGHGCGHVYRDGRWVSVQITVGG